jgi:hypothetical protein
LSWSGKGREERWGTKKVRFGFLIAAATAALLVNASAPPASAGLIGNGTNTVSASYWFPSSSVPPPACDDTTNPHCENEVESPDNATPTIPANFGAGAVSESTISVGDSKIVITNQSNTPFCSTSPCSDVFNGFAFSFSSGVDITGVTTDPKSAADFGPSQGASHSLRRRFL